jgi:hypothetical protein
MGTQYYVGCNDCNVKRDIDKKMDWVSKTPCSRESALRFSERIAHEPFRVGLLLSFLLDHNGHDVTVFSEHTELESLINMREEDVDFWKE